MQHFRGRGKSQEDASQVDCFPAVARSCKTVNIGRGTKIENASSCGAANGVCSRSSSRAINNAALFSNKLPENRSPSLLAW